MTLRGLIRHLLGYLPVRTRLALSAARNRSKPQLGSGTFVHPTVQMLGKSSIRVGDNSVLSQNCWLNVNHRDSDGFAVEIGNHCFIGRGNFFSSGAAIRIGPYVLTAHDCHFLGSTHLIDDPSRPCITTGTTNTGSIIIGANTFFGAGVKVLGSVSIGHGCVVGAASLVTRDAPPFSQLHGSPARVHRRYSFPRQAWVAAADFTEEDAAALPDELQYIRQLRQHPAPAMPYLAAGNDMGDC